MDAPVAAPLERCPMCLYLLEGLPAETRCPECGCELDRRWVVFGGKTMLARRPLRKWAVALSLFPLAIYAVVAARFNAPWTMLILFGLMLVMPLAMWLFPAVQFIAVGPAGLVVDRGRRGRNAVSWDRLHNAVRMGKLVVINTERGENLFLNQWGFFRNDLRETDACVRAINEAKQRFANDVDATRETETAAGGLPA